MRKKSKSNYMLKIPFKGLMSTQPKKLTERSEFYQGAIIIGQVLFAFVVVYILVVALLTIDI